MQRDGHVDLFQIMLGRADDSQAVFRLDQTLRRHHAARISAQIRARERICLTKRLRVAALDKLTAS